MELDTGYRGLLLIREIGLACRQERRLRKPQRAAIETAGIEVSRVPDRLHVKHGPKSIVGRFRNDCRASDLWHHAAGHGLTQDAADKRTLVSEIETHDRRYGAADIGVAGGRGIDEPRFEIGTGECHEVPGFSAAERAVRALTLLERCIANHDGTAYRFTAHRIERAKIDDNSGPWRLSGTVEIDVGERQRAGE